MNFSPGRGGGPPQAVEGAEVAAAEASVTSVTTVTGRGGADAGARLLADDRAAGVLNGFEGVALDAEAAAAIRLALEACAVRARTADAAYDAGGDAALDAAEDDPAEPFLRAGPNTLPWRGTFEPSFQLGDEAVFQPAGEAEWWLAGAEIPPEYVEVIERMAKEGPSTSLGLSEDKDGASTSSA